MLDASSFSPGISHNNFIRFIQVANANAATVFLIVYAVCATLIILVLVLLVFGLCQLTISRLVMHTKSAVQ